MEMGVTTRYDMLNNVNDQKLIERANCWFLVFSSKWFCQNRKRRQGGWVVSFFVSVSVVAVFWYCFFFSMQLYQGKILPSLQFPWVHLLSRRRWLQLAYISWTNWHCPRVGDTIALNEAFLVLVDVFVLALALVLLLLFDDWVQNQAQAKVHVPSMKMHSILHFIFCCIICRARKDKGMVHILTNGVT